MPNAKQPSSTAVWYFVTMAFLCAGAVFALTLGGQLLVMSTLLALGALAGISGAVVAIRESRDRKPSQR
ncbi:hypothetical protein ACH82I_16445 [Brevibacterium sp. GP-SGM9]|uniref:hypothetical protein n=1 Tax=unclassified Brevibacterium TaxID=2614124 RepID=UPI001E2DB785|nr:MULTISPECIES: hypothetical protein [unclassified Brevibacterium]MCD1285786.1 hypothetical protein [Brevibacterium sp. CCUG 69071]MDK8434846.1 hypothetical protein [Brevibacterium sp. H-BE7]